MEIYLTSIYLFECGHKAKSIKYLSLYVYTFVVVVLVFTDCVDGR